MNELIVKDIEYQTGIVKFNNFELYLKQAQEIADYISNTTLTEDNIKSVKKDLADARRVTRELDKIRIKIKKELLKPYDEFERQVKQLNSIINDADSEVRDKVKEMEEKERQIKKAAIKEIFDKRVVMYDVADYLDDPFDEWLTPQHLNKTVTMTKVERDMTDWLEHIQKDIDTVKAMDDSGMLLVEYIRCLDINDAIMTLKERQEMMKKVETTEETATFIIKGKANIKLVEMLLRENGIEFTRK